MSKRILLIDDDVLVLGALTRALRSSFEVVTACTLEGAEQAFMDNPNFDLIAVDGSLSGGKLDTVQLVLKIRAQKYEGHLLAISGMEDYNQELCKNGCNDFCEKMGTAQKIRELLG